MKKLEHIAIIMDGNKRWAEKNGYPSLRGHAEGAETVRKITRAAREFGIKYLTLYAFSTENWKRSSFEINGLMTILRSFIKKNIDEICQEDMRLMAIGRIDNLPQKTKDILTEAIEKTKDNKHGTLILALSYGGRAEIVDAVKKIVHDSAYGMIDPEKIDENIFNKYLYAPEIPDPDLLIRTSGEFRLSNFLLWQISYSEIWVTDTLWPDFSKEELKKAIDIYYSRERRYGGR